MNDRGKQTLRALAIAAALPAWNTRIAHGQQSQPAAGPPDMVWVPGGEFTMGSDAPDAWPAEGPAHRARVSGFWMDRTEVTNAQYREFVETTGYVTTAEKAPDLKELMSQVPPGTPPPPKELLVPGSLVFFPTDGPVPLEDYSAWWRWTPGADWRHPEGPDSDIKGRDSHPVVHVSWFDAKAYADWAGKSLPTEPQWEFAARGGLDAKHYVWGDDEVSDDKPQSNIWQGDFPYRNTASDRFPRTAPVGSFSANAYGLFDMAGNVWEWCGDWYRVDLYRQLAGKEMPVDPVGPDQSFDPSQPFQPQRVIRGGSFLCHRSYCASYRPSARRGSATDTGMSHQGFRCVMSPEQWRKRAESRP